MNNPENSIPFNKSETPETGISSSETSQTEQVKWDETRKFVEGLADKLGHPTDEGIKEPLVALNVLGFETKASCEGHLDWGHAYPWVMIGSSETEKAWEKVTEAFEKEDEAKAQGKSEEEVDLLEKISAQLQEEARRPLFDKARELSAYLEDFYKDQNVPYGRMLFTSMGGTFFELQSLGSKFQKAANEETKKKNLEEYQEEMQAFAKFLKDEFFNQ